MQHTNSKRIKKLILQKRNKIYLLRKNIKITRFSNKLNYKKLELFKILQQIFLINYKLVLSYRIRIY
ncbi:hypothetical protein M406DRAFT_234968, partial [Cryphonectria parasitica EP155]